MDVQQLRSFRSVVATGSVRAAAEALGYSPSAISQQLAQLRRETKVELLNRVGRGVEPTAAGTALAQRIDGLLGELGDLDSFVRSLRDGRLETARLVYFSSLGSTWLPRIVSPFLDRFPGINLELGIADLFDPAARPRPDLQLVVRPDDFSVPVGYVVHEIAEDPYVVALPPGHPLGDRDWVELRELEAYAWVDNDFAQGWCRQVIVEACAAAGYRPAYRIQTHDYPTALGLVAAGVGISVMPSLGARELPAGVRKCAIAHPCPTRNIVALVRKEASDQPAVGALLELAHIAAASM